MPLLSIVLASLTFTQSTTALKLPFHNLQPLWYRSFTTCNRLENAHSQPTIALKLPLSGAGQPDPAGAAPL